MIKYDSVYVKQIETLFGDDSVRQLDQMTKEERKRYYYHIYTRKNQSLSPSIWLFRNREKNNWYMTHKEIAEKLNITVSIVKTSEKNALRKIYKYFKYKNIKLEDIL